MTDSPPPKSALGLAMLLTLLGSCGVSSGLNAARSSSLPTAEALEIDDDSAPAETAPMVVAIAKAQLESPHRRPLGMVNCVLSGLLFAGGFALGTRRRGAPWFIENALVANILYVGAATYFGLRGFELHRAELLPVIEAYVQASVRSGETPLPVREQSQVVFRTLEAAIVLGAGLSLSFHVLALAWNRRPAIRAFVDGDE